MPTVPDNSPLAAAHSSVAADQANYMPDITSAAPDGSTDAARIHGERYGRLEKSGKESEDSYCALSHFDGGKHLTETEANTLRDAIVEQVREHTQKGPGAATFVTVLTGESGISFASIGDSHLFLVAQDGEVMKLNTPHKGVGGFITNWIGHVADPDDKTKAIEPLEGDQAGFVSYKNIKTWFDDQPVKIVMASDGLLEQYRSKSDRFNRKDNHADVTQQDEAAMKAFVAASGGTDTKTLASSALKSGSKDDITVVTMDVAPGHAASLSDGMGGNANGKFASRKAIEIAAARIQEWMRQHDVVHNVIEMKAFDPETLGTHIPPFEREATAVKEYVPPASSLPDKVRIALEEALKGGKVVVDDSAYPKLKGDPETLKALKLQLHAEGVTAELITINPYESMLFARDKNDSDRRMNPLLKELKAIALQAIPYTGR